MFGSIRRVWQWGLSAIRRLHVGQLVLLWAVALAIGLWLKGQYRAAVEAEQMYEMQYLTASARALTEMSAAPTDTAKPRKLWAAIKLLPEQSAAQRALESNLLVTGVTMSGVLLLVTWVWFGGRRKRAEW